MRSISGMCSLAFVLRGDVHRSSRVAGPATVLSGVTRAPNGTLSTGAVTKTVDGLWRRNEDKFCPVRIRSDAVRPLVTRVAAPSQFWRDHDDTSRGGRLTRRIGGPSPLPFFDPGALGRRAVDAHARRHRRLRRPGRDRATASPALQRGAYRRERPRGRPVRLADDRGVRAQRRALALARRRARARRPQRTAAAGGPRAARPVGRRGVPAGGVPHRPAGRPAHGARRRARRRGLRGVPRRRAG